MWPVLVKNNLGTFGFKYYWRGFPPLNKRNFSMSYHYMNFNSRSILWPKKFKYWNTLQSQWCHSHAVQILRTAFSRMLQCTKTSLWLRILLNNYCLAKHVSVESAQQWQTYLPVDKCKIQGRKASSQINLYTRTHWAPIYKTSLKKKIKTLTGCFLLGPKKWKTCYNIGGLL